MARTDIVDVYQLSPMQHGMLFHTLFAPDEDAYLEQFVCIIRGPLNVSAWKRAWQRVIDLHPVLRTGFHWENLESPVQVVHRHAELPFDEQDWRGQDEAVQQKSFEEYLQEDRKRGFNLAKPPLVRMASFHLADGVYRLIVTSHHILVDGWSMQMVFGQMNQLYAGYCRNEIVSVPVGRPFHDYIAWLQKQDQNVAEAFWRAALQGFTAPTPLPGQISVARPHSEAQHTEIRLELTQAESEKLQRFARQQQLTLNTLVQAAWGLLLVHYTGHKDVVFGQTVSGRPPELAGVDRMIGLFINTVPVRVQVREDETLTSWLKDIQRGQVEARQYEHASLTSIQGWSEVERGKPLFDTLMVFENQPMEQGDDAAQAELQFDELACLEHTNYPLTFTAWSGSQVGLKLNYNALRYSAELAWRILAHVRNILNAFVSGKSATLGAINLLSEAERERFAIWNRTHVDYPALCTHELFEQQVERTPNACAVLFEDQQLTFAQLNQRSNQLARYLIKHSIGPDVRVGLFIERSLELVVALLGVLKAGGTYVPLDPAYPPERLDFMLRDSEAPVLLVQEKFHGVLTGSSARIISLDGEWEQIASEDGNNPNVRLYPENLAYLLYTSGSTGRPKAVATSHGALSNHMQWMKDAFGWGPQDVFLQKSSTSFDASVWEFYAPLLTGGKLVMAIPRGQQDSTYLSRIIQVEKVTVLQLVPSVLRLLLEDPAFAGCQGLKVVFCGGEPLTWDLAKQFWGKFDTPLGNLYGPTEVTIEAVYWLSKATQLDSITVPVGKLISNMRAYVVNDRMQPVPLGVVGELFFSGPGLARGYLGRPAMTAERFVPDPFSDVPGERLFCTGDLARWSSDGNLELLGRIDHQVKIRGFRIELGEIEAALENQPGVAQAVVVAREDGPGDKRLVGYLVRNSGAPAVNMSELRASLRQRLPEYMVPSALVELEQFPFLPNGKVDRSALRSPDSRDREKQYVKPRTPEEEILCGVWEEVLKREQVGIRDDFFELGGHSLLAMRLVSRMRNALSVEVPLRVLFDRPTIEGIAEWLEQETKNGARMELLPIPRVPRDQPLPLSYAQQRLWFLDRMDPGTPVYNITGAFRLKGDVNTAALEMAFQEIVRRHESLRTCFAERDGVPVQVIGDTPLEVLRHVDLRTTPATERQKAVHGCIAQEFGLGFDLKHEIPLRVTLLHLSEREYVVVLVMHHIASDGWSMAILIEELSILYESFRQGKPAGLPELAIQYGDFAAWQQQWLQGEVLEEQLQYWREQLEAALVLELPTDQPRPAVPIRRGKCIDVQVPHPVTAGLKKLGREEGVTLFMVLLGGFTALLHRYTAQNDIVVGTPIAGRRRSETEGLIGFFVNMLPLRSDLSGDPTFRQLLQRERETTIAAYAHQDLPFEKLVDELQPDRDLSRTPFFSVVFTMQNAIENNLIMQDVELDLVHGERDTAKFDLTVMLEDTGSELLGNIEYSTELYEERSIRNLWQHYLRILSAAVAAPDRRLSQLNLLSEEERRKLLAGWTAASVNPGQQLLCELAAAHAQRKAVCYEGRQLSYAELDSQSNQLAHYLVQQGVTPGSFVGIDLEQPIEALAGILGVWKAGAAFVPLETDEPRKRLHWILQDSGIHCVLAGTTLADRLTGLAMKSLDLNALAPELAKQDSSRPEIEIAPDAVACALYRSGGSGQPEGVLIQHRSLAGLGSEISSQDVVALRFSFAEDANFSVICKALAAGACVVGIPNVKAPRRIANLLPEHQVTVLLISAAMLDRLAREFPRTLKTVRQIICTEGEGALPRLQSVAPDVLKRLVIPYGPAEVGGNVVVYTALSESTPAHSLAPGSRLYLLDSALEPAPEGALGHIYLETPSLALGYHGQGGRTAQDFVPDPFSRVPGKRLFRTGDLGKWRANGTLEYLGRRDAGTTIAGRRVQLEEIEATLTRHEAVRSAAVIAEQEINTGRISLTACVVFAGEEPLPDAELRTFLEERLPQIMVPHQYVFLEEIPYRDGEIDRRALLRLMEQKQAEKAYEPPRNETEERLVQVWAQTLNVERVGIRDNFFQLGGHSLLATQLVARIEDAFNIDLPLRKLFEAPDVAALAKVVDEFVQSGENHRRSQIVAASEVLEGVTVSEFVQKLEGQKSNALENGDQVIPAVQTGVELIVAGLEGLTDAEVEALLGPENLQE
jgi:amino acid adenylation domain-containing protein